MVLLVIAALLVPLSIVTAWARVQLVDEDRFVGALAPLASDEAVQDLIAEQAMAAIDQRVDYDGLTAAVIDGIVSLGLPPRAASALDLLRAPAAEGLRAGIERAVDQTVASPAFSTVWTTTTQTAHRALTLAATSDGGGVIVRTSDDGVGIALGPVVETLRDSVAAERPGIATLIPSVDRVITIGSGQSLWTLRTTYALATAVGAWLPWITLLVLAAAVAVAPRRPRALVGAGVAIAAGAGAAALALFAGVGVAASFASDAGLSSDGVRAIATTLTADMRTAAVLTAAIGAALCVGAWVFTRRRTAQAKTEAPGQTEEQAQTEASRPRT